MTIILNLICQNTPSHLALNGREPIQSIIDSEHLSLDDSQQYFDSMQECINNINSIEHNDEER